MFPPPMIPPFMFSDAPIDTPNIKKEVDDEDCLILPEVTYGPPPPSFDAHPFM